MGLYDSNGYLNIEKIIGSGQPFIFVVGGRGTGKTYGMLKYVLDNNIPFIYMRRTQAQADIINKPEFSPFKSLEDEYLIASKPLTKYNSGFYHAHIEDDQIITDGAPVGYSLALSTVSNLRGFDMSDVQILIYDEFIGERHERTMKNEAGALFNCYETINRNREIKGCNPLMLVCLANATNLSNPIFDELGLVNRAVKMQQTGRECSIMQNKGIALYILNASPISNKKKDTALYRLTRGSEFYGMAIDNNFNVSTDMIKSVNIKEYKPVIKCENLTIYRHKSGGGYYITTFTSGAVETIKKEIFKTIYGKALLTKLYTKRLFFDSVQTLTTFHNIVS